MTSLDEFYFGTIRMLSKFHFIYILLNDDEPETSSSFNEGVNFVFGIISHEFGTIF